MSEAPVTRAAAGSYYGNPVIKPPVWKPEIGWYFLVGGIAGAAAPLGLAARAAGNHRLARTCTYLAAAGTAASPYFLIKDLGRPERFLNMLRVFKPTSPMSVGSWLLAVSGGVDATTAACETFGAFPRLKVAAEALSAAAGPGLATYTAVLVANTAVPAWHEARRELPFVFAASSAATAGAAATILTPASQAGPARRLALAGAVAESAATELMTRRLGMVGEPYRAGKAGSYARAAKACTLAGAALMAARGRRPLLGRLASALLLAGGACLRFAVLNAGRQSAEDPRYTVEPQRARLRSGR